MFIIFINDISNINCGKLLFADDLKIFSTISSPEDSKNLQYHLNRVHDWCIENEMELNVKKCHIIRFYQGKTYIPFDYNLNNIPLDCVNTIKDLGILFDTSLKFTDHIDAIISKALQMLGFIKRNCHDFKSPNTLKLLYCSLVRPHLEYCSSIWSPYYNNYKEKIERVQNKFLRFLGFKIRAITGNNGFYNYEEIRAYINITTLEERRYHHDLKMLYNLLNGTANSNHLLSKIGFKVPSYATRGATERNFHVPFHRCNYGLNEPMTRMLRLANQNSDRLDFTSTYSKFIRDLQQTHVG